jgi:hypothetical protein
VPVLLRVGTQQLRRLQGGRSAARSCRAGVWRERGASIHAKKVRAKGPPFCLGQWKAFTALPFTLRSPARSRAARRAAARGSCLRRRG